MGMKKDVFGKGGMLHKHFGEKYELREGQMRMAVKVAKAFIGRNILLCEGATGIGKSFGYLIPAFSPATRAMREDLEGESKPIIVSTSTKILQDQLIELDVPAVSKATGVNMKCHVAKGRNNYLSWRRLENFQATLADNVFLFSDKDASEKSTIQANALAAWWSTIYDKKMSIDGEFANFTHQTYEQVLNTKVDPKDIETHFELHPEVVAAVQSDHTDCLGKTCPHAAGICPYYNKKRGMDTAGLIIANHTLLALHLRFHTVLPQANTFIIDEAHKFYYAVSAAFQLELGVWRIRNFLKIFMNRWEAFKKNVHKVDTGAIARKMEHFAKLNSHTENIAIELFLEYHRLLHQVALADGIINEQTQRYAYVMSAPVHNKFQVLIDELQKYVDRCHEFAITYFGKGYDAEDSVDDAKNEDMELSLEHDYQLFRLIYRSALNIATEAKKVLSHEAPNTYCYWAEIADTKKDETKFIDAERLTLIRTPIDITSYLKPLFAEGNSVIMTSATLTTQKGDFGRLKSQLGLKENPKVQEMVEPSPFPFKENAQIHLFSEILLPPNPSDGPEIHEAYFVEQTALCEYYLKKNHGRALILCTSRYFMNRLHERLTPVIQEIGVNGYIQNTDVNVKQLLSDFGSDETSVLFGVDSCWEGLDAPGDTLKTLIITRLPFTPPHPVTEARIKQLDASSNSFRDVLLPDMLLRLKQGVGRLIRSMTDTGVIAILDPRVLTKPYARDIQNSLPPARIVRNPVDTLEYLTGHKTHG